MHINHGLNGQMKLVVLDMKKIIFGLLVVMTATSKYKN